MNKEQNQKKNFFIISNRLPVSIKRKKETFGVQQSPGGLATGLRMISQRENLRLIGWPGLWPHNQKERQTISEMLKEHQCHPVFLSPPELEKYYYGFSNKALWPLFHYFPTYCTIEESEWKTYKKVNEKFAEKIFELAGPRDMFWVHDYHLMLLPELLRKEFPESTIGFFLHIPFPSSEVFRILPWRKEILKGLLGADLIGFHTYEYVRHFLSSVLRLLNLEHELGTISVDNRFVNVENFPMGIDFVNIEKTLKESPTQRAIKKLREETQAGKRKIILSVDRLDYSKGIPERLRGIEYFLRKNPRWHNEITFIMLCVPSRTKVKQYSMLKEEVDALVGKINGRFGGPNWTPIHYMYRSLPFKKLLPLYALADIALVTPLRDGMNLVAKEFVASKIDNNGVLILSETAGAASELGESLLINVNSKEDIALELARALEMDNGEQTFRMKPMRDRLFSYDIFKWTNSFVSRLKEIKELQAQHEHWKLNSKLRKELMADYQKSKKRLLLLDYDGTLISFEPKPDQAEPDKELEEILTKLSDNARNQLVVISGRDRVTMEKWLGHIPCALIAEHGTSVKKGPDHAWKTRKALSTQWKDQVKPILSTYSLHVPGSFIEEKEYGLAWHYRKSNPELGQMRASELFDYLSEFLANTDLQVMHGDKVIEIRNAGVNKGEAAKQFLDQKAWDFILAMGDDWTDEDLFKILPLSAYSIKVGLKITQARFYIDSPDICRGLLKELMSG